MKRLWVKMIVFLAILISWVFSIDRGIILAAETSPMSHPVTPLLEFSAQNTPSLDTSTIPFEKLNQFVQAYLQVIKLIERRQPELQAATTPAESQQLETEIQAQALAMIEQAGLTQPEYLQLLSLANTDPEFGERVALLLQEAQ